MTHLCCRPCRLRFPPDSGARPVACPACGEPPESSGPEGVLGYQAFRIQDVLHSLPEALAAALPVPDPQV